MSVAGVVELLRKAVQFIEWAAKALSEMLKAKRLGDIREAHDAAAEAKTREEKVAAAKKLEDAVGLKPRSRSAKPRG